jgi:hypothetical protein
MQSKEKNKSLILEEQVWTIHALQKSSLEAHEEQSRHHFHSKGIQEICQLPIPFASSAVS